MLSFLAAVSAPLRMRSQKGAPGGPWVIIATVTRGVSAWPAPIPESDDRGLPPVLEHAVIATRMITEAVMTRTALDSERFWRFIDLFSLAGGSADGGGVGRLEGVGGDLQGFELA